MFQQSSTGKLLEEPKIRNLNGDIYKVVDFFKYIGIHISVMKRKDENGGEILKFSMSMIVILVNV